MNTTDRILGEMLDASGLINGQKAQYLSVDQVNELSYTDMLMSMVPSPDSFDFGRRTTNQLRNGGEIFRKGLLDKLARDPDIKRRDYPELARSINGLWGDFLAMTNRLSWMIPGDEDRRRKNATGFFELQNDHQAKDWYESEVWRVLRPQLKELAKQLDPMGAIVYSMKQGEDVDWL
jgi:hypothetical protein